MTDAMREALRILSDERARLDRAIQILQEESEGSARRGRRGKASKKKAAKKRRRRNMSDEARRAVSERMRKYWAQRRKEKAKG
jgi:hypothetical protein